MSDYTISTSVKKVAQVQPTGTVTFLFTDIEDSSRYWDRHPVVMRDALREHDALLSGSIADHGGYVFTTAGDSFAAAFQTVDSAAAAAVTIQRAVGSAAWPAETTIRVRIGLHTGEADERDGDYFGPPVNLAARVEAAASGGQILCSAATAGLLAHSADPDWELTDLGSYTLKGLSSEVAIHQLGGGDFGPLRVAHATTQTNLGPNVPELVGRESDIESLCDLVGAHRLVSVLGIGGIGKTSIAVVAASKLQPEFDEVWLVDLAPIGPADVNGVAAKVFGIAGAPRDATTIADVMASRGRCFVILDNCEHVLSAAVTLCEALAQLANVSILATSRLALELRDEHVFRLPPLGTTEPAIDLFVREAQRQAPDFKATKEHREAIEAICDQVDGIPLAIELVAAKIRTLDPPEILSRLSSILGSPARSGRTREGQRTMTAAIDWSIELLDDELRAALGACTVFAGTFDLAAAEQVVGATSGLDPALSIDELVAHSLIEAQRSRMGVRYRMLEPVRQRAEQSRLSDEAVARDAHLDHYLTRLESAYETFATTSCDPLLDLAFHDLDNLRNVHRWALESNRIEDDLRLYWPLAVTAYHDVLEPGDWAAETLKTGYSQPSDEWERALCASALFATMKNDTTHVIFARQALEDALAAGRTQPALTLMRCFGLMFIDGALEEAVALWDTLKDATDPYVRFEYFAKACFAIRGAASASGRPRPPCDDLFETGVAWAQSIGARNLEAAIHEVSALIALEDGDFERCHERAALAIDLAHDAKMGFFESRAREHLARTQVRQDKRSDAASSLLQILREAINSGNNQTVGLVLGTCAELFATDGRREPAALCIAAYPFGNLPTETWPGLTDDLLANANTRFEGEKLTSLHVAELIRPDLEAIAASE